MQNAAVSTIGGTGANTRTFVAEPVRRDNRPVRRNSYDTVLAMAVCVAAAVAATWPLVLRPGRFVAGDLGDPILAATLLGWDADRVLHGFRHFWDAPYLFPSPHALAYSEHLLGIALFVAPIEWLTRNPILSYNLAYVGSYALAGAGMFLLARSLWGRADAALLAGLAFELSQYRLEQTSHIQVLMNGWMPVALWGLHRYFETGRRRWAALFGAGFLLAGLSNGYYFYFFLLPVVVLTAAELARPRLPRARIAADLLGTAAVVAVCVAPIALGYMRLRSGGGFERSEGELATFGAQLLDYLHVTRGAWSWGGLLGVGRAERNLFPGATMLVLAAVAVAVDRSRRVAAYALVAVLVVWASMGSHGGPIYAWLFHVVPGFNALRVPARLAAVALVACAVLAAAGAARIVTRLNARPARATFVLLAAGTIVLEGQRGVRLVEVPVAGTRTWDRVAYDWVASQPAGALLELDISASGDFRPDTSTLYQLETLRHHHPIVNGFTGWRSGLQDLLGDPASPLREPEQVDDALKGLRAIGVRYVLLHDRTFRNPDDAARLAADIRRSRSQIVEEHQFGGTWAWRLAEAPAASAALDSGLERIAPPMFTLAASHQPERLRLAIDGDIDTRWLSGEPQQGREWIELRFAQVTDVGRVRLENEPRSVFDYPRHLVVESLDADGRSRVLFDGGIADRLIVATVADDQRAPVAIDLPPNRTTVLRLRQTGQARPWWSVHELAVWRRAPRALARSGAD